MTKERKPEEEVDRKPWPRLRGDFLASSLLAYLRNWNAYGYQLVQELAKAGLPAFDSGTVYRTLRQLERAGLVSSFWDTSRSGPARRMYSLTKAGEGFLTLWIDRKSVVQGKSLDLGGRRIIKKNNFNAYKKLTIHCSNNYNKRCQFRYRYL